MIYVQSTTYGCTEYILRLFSWFFIYNDPVEE